MNRNQETKAYAKINLNLEVFNKRSDGYHNIFGLMASVDLCDHLKLERLEVGRFAAGRPRIGIRNAGGEYAGMIDELPTEDNLIARAAAAYLEGAGLSGSVDFTLVKNIPAGAGLGGGSSDAAAALKLLDRELGIYARDELERLGAKLGADVPYCLRGGFVFCEGIGEVMEDVKGRLDHEVVVVASGIHVDTGRAYKALKRSAEAAYPGDLVRERKLRFSAALALGDLDPVKTAFINDFEGPVFAEYPELLAIKERLYGQGADYAVLTGSGSGVIGLFSDAGQARRSQAAWDGSGRAILTRFIY